MEMLPIVSFIIYSTGLCTIALLGLSISDTFTERLKARTLRMSNRAASLPLTTPAAQNKPASAPLREQLLKAA